MKSEQLSHSPTHVFTADLHDAIRRRAEEIYIQSGRIPGHDVDNWTKAEHEIMEQVARRDRRVAIMVKVDGVRYVGEYLPDSSDGYVPGEIGVGASITVRFEGDNMYVRRANGKELVTRIVQKIS